jgi:predicted DNA binding protein
MQVSEPDPGQLFDRVTTVGAGKSTSPLHAPPAKQFGVAKIRFLLPAGTPFSVVSRRHPELVLILVGEQPTLGGRILLELDAVDPQNLDLSKELRRAPGVVSVARLGSRQSRTRFRVVADPPRHLMLAIALEAVFRYPVVIKDGHATIIVEAEVSRLRHLLRGLRRLSGEVKLLSWGRENLPTFPPQLTSRQQALLYQAIAAGYFDVPRRITLTALANQVHRSKSSVSRALSLIENRIVEASVLASI